MSLAEKETISKSGKETSASTRKTERGLILSVVSRFDLLDHDVVGGCLLRVLCGAAQHDQVVGGDPH